MEMTLKSLIEAMVKKRASDLHISAGSPPRIRVDGSLVALSKEPLDESETHEICFECLNQEQVMRFESEREIDLSFNLEGIARVRANIYWTMGSVAGAFRAIPLAVPDCKELCIPEEAVALAGKPHGLILVTGPAGSGRSTTVAAMIERINQTRSAHVITLEDPIEYVYQQKKCVISQREAGSDTLSFQNALKYILRQDPDVVVIGEIKDLETIQSAIALAETGCLVFATFYTGTPKQTIERITAAFPPQQQEGIRKRLSLILEGIISQKLSPKTGGGRSLETQILLRNTAEFKELLPD